MGIKGLNKLISQYAPSSISQKDISEFKGTKVAIDSEILIHKFRSVDSRNSHIFGFINNVFWHLENGIVPIYVFDGCPTNAKINNALSKRFVYKEQINRKVEELENKFVEQLDKFDENDSIGQNILSPEINETLDQLNKIKKKISFMSVNKNHRNECKYLLKLLGIPFVVAEDDAEAFCVTLQKRKIADYVYTEDTDIIPYFIANMYNEQTNESSSDEPILEQSSLKILKKGYLNSMVTVIDINEILDKMELKPKSFIDMCILSGCDFCNLKMSSCKAYSYIKKYYTIEKMKEAGVLLSDDFKYQDARDIFFRTSDKIIDKELELGQLNLEGLREYLYEERKLNPAPVIEKYYKVMELYNIKALPAKTAD